MGGFEKKSVFHSEALIVRRPEHPKKCHAAHKRPYLGLLKLINTPTEGFEPQPCGPGSVCLVDALKPVCLPNSITCDLPLTMEKRRNSKKTERQNGLNPQDRDVNFVHWPSVNQCVYNPLHLIKVNGDQQLLRDSYLTEHCIALYCIFIYW